MTSKLLTNSRMSTFRSCQRKHHIQYELGYRPVAEDENLSFGTLIHKALEAWWKKPAHLDRLPDALAVMSHSNPFQLAKARAMIVGYDARWGDEVFEVLGVELQFRAPGPSGFELAGKLDVLVPKHVIEHKTSGEDITPGSLYWRRLRTDSQVDMYFNGAASLGQEIDSIIYDVLGKPGLRPKKNETPDEYFRRCVEAISLEPDAYYQRQHVTRLERDRAEALADTNAIAHQIATQEGHVPRNPGACMSYGRLCGFFGVCAGEQSLDNAEHFKQSDNVHPELETDHA